MARHVLVVEHDDRIRDTICKFLERAGIENHSTSSAQGALADLPRLPSLIVLDVALPDQHGIEVLRAVREFRLAIDVAVIASCSDLPALEALGALQPDAILGKPFDFQDFAEWLSARYSSPCQRLFVARTATMPTKRRPLSRGSQLFSKTA